MRNFIYAIFVNILAIGISNNVLAQLSCYHIVLDAGHGGTDPGSYCANGVAEKVLTLEMCQKLRTNLMNKGATVAMTRSTDVFVSLTNRRDFINNENPDAAISIHLNAYNGVVQGTETFWCAGTPSNALANQVQPLLVSTIGYNNRGVKNSCFTVLTTNTSIPTILTEALFHDEPNGCTFINNSINQTNIANAHAVGIQNYLPVCSSVINNDCANAIQLQSDYMCNFAAGTLTGASASSLSKPSCDVFGNPAKKDVFYVFTALQDQHIVVVDPSGTGADAVDAVVSVYTGANCNTLTEVACGGGTGGSGGSTKTLNLNNLNIGQTYWIRIYDYGTIDPVYPNFEICVTHNTATSTSLYYDNNFYLNIFPNPTPDIINIDASENVKAMSIKNSLGQEVIKYQPHNKQFKTDISFLIAGFYMIEIRFENRVVCNKIIKKY